MYVIVAELKVKPDQVERFGGLIDGQAKESVELEEQCHQFDVCQAEGDPSHFLLYETYDDRAAFDKHRQMAHTTRFLAEVKPMIIEMSVRGFSRRG
jgi:autoinducer 2-degrading protein